MNLDRPLAEIFVEEGYVERDQLSSILSKRENTTESIGHTLVRLGSITETQRLKCVALQTGVPFLDIASAILDENVCKKLNHAVAFKCLAIPVEITELAATVAMANPLDLSALDLLSETLGVDIDPMWAAEEDVREALQRIFGHYDDLEDLLGSVSNGMDADALQLSATLEDEEPINVIELREVAEEGPVVKLVNALIARAVKVRASDIHIEPRQRSVCVRFRVDGLLQEVMHVPKELHRAIASRIKVVAGLDIAERRSPQDGRCTMMSSDGEYDFRVATYPSVYGEKVTIRVLDKSAVQINVNRLGIDDDALKVLLAKSEESQGLVLVTGPTGSGKTTTLYSILQHLNGEQRNIITIEDPVEYQLDGIMQANVNALAGLTFASGLRAILRQDPDIILVGESRDPETAHTTIEAALTGHMVFTSLHANDSASAVTRLMEMGIEPFLVGSSVSCSVAQRLIRLNCPLCAESYKPASEVLERLNLPIDGNYKKGAGCEKCSRTGYRGRAGAYEILEITTEIRKMILRSEHSTTIREHAAQMGMTTMRCDALKKVRAGLTTVEEVLRVTPEDHAA